MRVRRGRLLWTSVVVIWLVGVGAGVGALWHYSLTPGTPGQASPLWPAESRIARDPARATLVLFAHPDCPCTRASLGELDAIMAQTQGRLAVRVVISEAPGVGTGRLDEGLGVSAAAIPGVLVAEDEGGFEAQRFGAATSGQTFLYDRAARLIFAGGITAARGHAGANVGSAAVVSLVNKGTAASTRTDVFGCLLVGVPAPRS